MLYYSGCSSLPEGSNPRLSCKLQSRHKGFEPETPSQGAGPSNRLSLGRVRPLILRDASNRTYLLIRGISASESYTPSPAIAAVTLATAELGKPDRGAHLSTIRKRL